MRIYALVGSSGTGKSYQSMMLAKREHVKYIIDDGLLIKGNKVLCGSSAKREKTRMAAVKRALFMDETHKNKVIDTIREQRPDALLILGTSDKMINKIMRTLKLGELTECFYISDLVSREEIEKAQKSRTHEGKHIIPVPTFEIKKDFSGYFLNPLKIFRKLSRENDQEIHEKSVVRPTFSYRGKYTISDRVIREIVYYVVKKTIGIERVIFVDLISGTSGAKIKIGLNAMYGNPIKALMELVQGQVKSEVEEMTSINIIAVDIFVKNIVINE
ncbi:MAG: hypothetical protein COA82_07725 [Alkaliphilus sp.]|nr:Asp23/Gls24 family envelope stress response protein [bacterium AH-315-L21]MBN4067576.1 Asp23/Gls24 family envelope stress response protein [Alkaliphilus transvaalensis]PHS33871.1 MAG: hypothetical protein COA82_07725 [Alkaliphilus sp.]